jgi:NADH dehydrogenase (ubiquinone) 1 alpha subcomplex subunit 2
MKKNNPNTPIMLREAAGTQPKVYARYGTISLNSPVESEREQKTNEGLFLEFGQEKSASLLNMSDKEIEEKVAGLVKSGL